MRGNSRNREFAALPFQVLGYEGYLMTDGYEGYNALANSEGIERDGKDAKEPGRFLARQRLPRVRSVGCGEARTASIANDAVGYTPQPKKWG